MRTDKILARLQIITPQINLLIYITEIFIHFVVMYIPQSLNWSASTYEVDFDCVM